MYLFYKKHQEKKQKLAALHLERLARIDREKKINQLRKRRIASLHNIIREKHLDAGMTLEEINTFILRSS
tara:strand:+ start:634 stop:843 length:210 start_codon:yes stop_codon:yes gene_type:complete